MMMMTATTTSNNNNNSDEKKSANPPSSSATTTTKKSNGKSATSKVVASLENQILVLTKERDEAREFGETTVALFKKEKMQLKNEAKETQVLLLNEKRLWEQERKGLNEEVKRLESEVERLKREKEASQEDNNNNNINNNNDISLTEFLDMEVALDKERERSANLVRDLEAKAKEHAMKNEQTNIEISKMTAERETLKANVKNLYKKLNDWDQMQAENLKAHEALLRKEVEVHKQHYQSELERAQKEHEFHLQYEKNQKEQQYERYEREKNEIAEREYSKYRREVERAVSEARARAEEEFSEKIEQYERETRSKEREIRKEIRLLEIECEKMVEARVKEAVKTIARSVEETFEKTTNTGLCFSKALDEQKKKIDALGMKCATMVGKAEIELKKISAKREEALRELANAIEMTSEKRREFERFEEKMHHREFHAHRHHRSKASPSSEQEDEEYDDPFSPESKSYVSRGDEDEFERNALDPFGDVSNRVATENNYSHRVPDESDEVHSLMRQVKLLRRELEGLAKTRKEESSALKKKVLRTAERKREKKKEKKEILTSVRSRLDSLMLMN
jgi:HAMP domain-containing protein